MLGFGKTKAAAAQDEALELPRGAQLLDELYPRYRRLLNKQLETLRRKNEVIAELKLLSDAILASGARHDFLEAQLPAHLRPKPATDHPEGVRKIMDDLVPDFVAPEPRQIHPNIPRYDELRTELRHIDEALPVIERELAAAHREASRLVCEAIRAEYQKEIGGRVIRAVDELGSALKAHVEFRHEFRNVNLVMLKPLPVAEYFGDINATYSLLHQVMNFAEMVGHNTDETSDWRK